MHGCRISFGIRSSWQVLVFTGLSIFVSVSTVVGWNYVNGGGILSGSSSVYVVLLLSRLLRILYILLE